MKKLLIILSLAFCLSPIAYGQDVQRFAERGTIGTARYVGMGGAMTAIGGDPSSAMDNPAGLGLYRHSEISASIDVTIDNTRQTGSNDTYQRTRFAAPTISAIWAKGRKNRQRGLIFSNLMVSFNRLNSYNREVQLNGKDLGLASTICTKTNKLPEQELEGKPWDFIDIGWLSILGYETYLIDPVENSQWIPSVDLQTGKLIVSETGSTDQYTMMWAGNINNQWYIGASLNIPTITYTKHTSLFETDGTNSAELKSMFHTSGVGFTANIGIIYRPIEWIRIGTSIQTPTIMSLSVQTEGDMHTNIKGKLYKEFTPASGVVHLSCSSPLRTTFGIAGQWKHHGMLSLQYDYAHAIPEQESGINPMNDVHTLRVGIESQVYTSLYLNAGYVYQSSFTVADPVVALDYNSIRTDLDYRFTQSSQYISFGIGYRNRHVVANVAYQYNWQALNQYATEHQFPPIIIDTHTHRIVATLAWRI